MTVVGVDISSRRVDLAWLENGKPQRWHVNLGGPSVHLIDRVRACHLGWPDYGRSVTDIAVEYPFGRGATTLIALGAVLGAITRQAPTWARVAWPSAGELRQAIGAPNHKYEAGLRIQTLHNLPHPSDPDAWNEHELDALVACSGWTAILATQDAA